ncbi:hypothetical protein QTP88_001235 [Uroleucon formosanum]
MESKPISYLTEASSEELLNNCSRPKVSHAKINFTEKSFDDYLKNIKIENRDASSGLDNFTSIACPIVSMHTRSPSPVLPIIKILSPKSGPHICLKCCFKCNKVFRVLDSPLHICEIRSINKKNKFLKIEPSLCDDSCLCDFCWKNLNKTYKFIKSKNQKDETYLEKKYRLLERYVKKNVPKNQNQGRRCSIHLCSRSCRQKMTVNECENIKKLFSTFESSHLVFIQSKKQTIDFLKFPFCLCKIHKPMILVISTCQICGDKLNAPFNTDDWSMYKMWNFVLFENNLPLTLKPGMFLCVTCKEHISKENPGFPTTNLPLLREYILKSNAIRFKLYGDSQYNLFNICKGSSYLASPLVISNIKEEKECVRFIKVRFSDPLITTNYNFELGCYKNETKSITSSVLLKIAEQNLCKPKLELKDESLDFVKLEEKHFKTNDNLFQNLCQFNVVEIDEDESGIICSRKIASEHNEIENNQSKLNSNAICSVGQEGSSMILIEGNQRMNEINTIHKKVYLNETNNSMYSFSAAVKPRYAIVNPVSIKRKQSNIKCDKISFEDVKKQKLNEKYSFYENNFRSDYTTKSYRNKIIAHSNIYLPSILNINCKIKYNSNSDISDSEIFSETYSEEILPEIKETDYIVVSSDDDLSLDSNCEFIKSKIEKKPDHEIEMDCKFLSDSEKSLVGKIILNGENVLQNCTTYLDNVRDSNCEMVPDAKTESDSDEQSHISISVTEKSNEKLSTFKIESNVQKRLDHEILLDGDEVIETASWSEKGMIKYKIIFDDEIKPSGNRGSTCIIISDNDYEFNNKEFSTYKVNVQKGSDCKILLDGEKVEILYESGNSKAKYEIDSSVNKESVCIIIFDDEYEFINKKLSTYKIVSNVKNESNFEMLLDGEKVYDIESDSENRNVKYMILSKNKIKSNGDKESQCTVISDHKNKFNNKKSTFKIVIKNFQNRSHSALMDGEKSCDMLSENVNGKVGNITITSNGKILVDDSQGLKTLDDINNSNIDLQLEIKYRHSYPCLELSVNKDGDAKQHKIQEYLKKIYFAIRYYFENTENQSLKKLYSQVDNDADMLLYLIENIRMLCNRKLFVSETANELYKDYLKEQITTLYHFFSNLKYSIYASRLFIHPSSHLHQYSKQFLSYNIQPLIIKDIKTISCLPNQSNSIVSSKKKFAANKCVGYKFNNIRTTKLSPLWNSVSKSRNNRISKIPNHLSTYTKHLLTSGIPHLPDKQTFTCLILQHPTKCNINFPVAIKNKTIS